MTTIYTDPTRTDDNRRRELYQGDLFVYTPNSATTALCEFAQSMLNDAFAPHVPELAHRELAVEEYVEILAELKPAFIHHPRCKELIQAILRDAGCDMSNTYFDVPRLRTATPSNYLSSGLAYAFKPHRDTWYSPPMCQINWWLPIYPIQSENCMAFHLNYWDRPIKNSSDEFNYQEWNQVGRRDAKKQVGNDTRRQSEALEEMQLDPQVRLICPDSGMIVFSAAHMHSTVPNTTDVTRMSIDFRTVHYADLMDRQGAPNIDGASTGSTLNDYLRGTDLAHLPQDLIDEYMNLEPMPEFDPRTGQLAAT